MANDTKFTKWLQRELVRRGATIKVSGKNDAASQAVISEFQRAMGLKVTGTATAETVQAVKNSKPATLKPTAVNQPSPGMSLSGSIDLKPPVIPPMHPTSVVGRTLPPGAGPDFGNAAPYVAGAFGSDVNAGPPSSMNMNDPTWQKISPEMQQRIMATEQQRVIDEHNQRVQLQQALNAKAQGVRDGALSMDGGGLLGPMSSGQPPAQASAISPDILQFLMQHLGRH